VRTFALVEDTDQRPHVVGQLRIDQAWGSAQLTGAAFQIRPANVFVGLNGSREFGDTEYGFAVQGGLKINLPMLAAGDQLWLQAAYSNGNISYIQPSATNFGRFSVGTANAVFNEFGDLERTRGFSLTAAFLHYWTPQIRQGFGATWTRVDVENSVAALPLAGFPGQTVFAGGSLVDFNLYEIGSNLIWSPVAGLDIGVEVLYRKLASDGGRIAVTEPRFAGDVVGTTVSRRSEDQFQARLRIQRDF
jgi:hypothetical protein